MCIWQDHQHSLSLIGQSEKLETSDKRPCWDVKGIFIDCMSSLPGDRSHLLIVTNRKLCYWLAVDYFCAAQMRRSLFRLSRNTELKTRQEAALWRQANSSESHFTCQCKAQPDDLWPDEWKRARVAVVKAWTAACAQWNVACVQKVCTHTEGGKGSKTRRGSPDNDSWRWKWVSTPCDHVPNALGGKLKALAAEPECQ